MRIRSFNLIVSTALLLPCVLGAQSRENAWAFTAGLGAGIANVPTLASPVYFDASQVTAHLSIQRALGGGLFGGVAPSDARMLCGLFMIT
jgi:hypothetical protein